MTGLGIAALPVKQVVDGLCNGQGESVRRRPAFRLPKVDSHHRSENAVVVGIHPIGSIA